LNRAKPINHVLHLLLTVALLVVASLVIAQSSRQRAPRRIVPANGQKAAAQKATQTGRKLPHNPIGLMKRLPPSITRRHLNDKLTRMARFWHPKGTRAVGDQGVPRQTVLLTKATPSANFSIDFATAQDQHPNWSGEEAYIYFDSDRVSDQDSTERPDGVYNIFRMVPDGSTVTQITTGSDQTLEPNISTASNRIAYVKGGQVLNQTIGQPTAPFQTNGFNLYVLDLNGQNIPRQLTNVATNIQFNFADVRHPSFAPGGDRICFAGKLAGDTVYHIYTIGVTQGDITQYTAGVANDYSPAWSPANAQSATVIAYTTNASALTPSAAPVVSTATKATDDVFVMDQNANRPSPRQITNFPAATNRNPAWSTNRQDTRINGIPAGTDSNGNVTGQGQTLLGFASTRADNDPNNPGVPNGLSGNGSTDIYYMNATIGPDLRDNSVITVTTPEIPFSNTGTYTGAHKLQTSNPQITVDALDKPGLTDFDPNHQSTEDFPTFPQFINSYRIAYQSDRGANMNLWASDILDLNAPTLLKYDETNNEIVHVERADAPGVPLLQRFVDPGTRVRIKVRAVDYESGIKFAYVQIKCPDSAEQSYDNQEHKIFYVGAGLLAPNLVVDFPPYEWDAQAIKASDTGAGAHFRPPGGRNAPPNPNLVPIPGNWPGYNLYTPDIDDITAYSGGGKPPDDATIPPDPRFFPDGENGYWLKLDVDPANPDTYQAEWQTPPGFASDMIIDVILYDNAVYPFDDSGGTTSNWKIYDNVWGFTTKRFTPQSQLLYVSDYDTGQKFLNSVFGLGDFRGISNIANLSFEGNPTEAWMTEFDPQLFPRTAHQATTTFALVNFLTPLGQNSYVDNLTGTGLNGGPITGQYDIWRIQCRGPVPDDVLNIYGTRTVSQPPDLLAGGTTPRTQLVADKCIIWHSPYTGDLFVGPGTLLDTDTQSRLTAFVNRGGRLFVNGQEVGFGLSLGQSNTPGSTTNDFLNNTLRAYYIADDSYIQFANNKINGPTEAQSPLHPIAFETWFDALHAYPDPTAPNQDPLKAPPIFIGYTTLPTMDHDYGCPNQAVEPPFILPTIGHQNLMQFNPPPDPPLPATVVNAPVTGKMYPGVYGIEAYHDPVANNPAIMWYKNVTTGGKVVFSPVGWETINPDQYIVATTVILRNRRVELMHNVLDLLRTGRIVGTIRVKNATGSATAPVANAFVRVQRPDQVSGILTTYGTARTQGDGSYVIEGLDATGIYNIDASKAGFITQHGTGALFHGGFEGRTDFFLIQAQPAIVEGNISTLTGGLPVSGAIVQAKDIIDPTDPNPPTFLSDPSDTNGNYVIRNLPASTYRLTVTNFVALGYSGSVPDHIDVTVAPSQDLKGQNFQLTQPPGTVTGFVFVADANGNPTTTPIAGATVTATSTTVPPGTGGTATTDTNGAYTLSLGPGGYQLVASAPGYSPSNPPTNVTVLSGKTVPNINFALKALPPGSVSGLVTTSPPLSLPIGGATITVADSTGKTLTATTTAVQTVTLADGTTYKFNYIVTNVSAGATVTVTATKAGYTPKPNPDTQTVAVATGAETRNVNFILDPLFTFNGDLTLVSSPFEFPGTVADLFSIPASDINNTFAFVTWDAVAQKYIYYPTPPADNFHLGRGYFMQETDTLVTLALTNPNGTTAPKDATGNYQPFSIALQNGWNLIGTPFTNPIDLSKLQIQEANGTLVDVPTAQSGGSPAIGSALFTYEHGAYEVVFTLDPFRGYWMRAFRPVTLIVTAGAQQIRSVGQAKVTRATDSANVTGDGWRLKLKATAGDTVTGNAYVGVSRSASDGFDQFKLQSPPAATKQSVQIAFTHKDWGDKSADYMMDIRSPSATSWEFSVTSNVANTPVTLSWPDIATLSRHQQLNLVDLDTKQTVSLRNRSSVTIPASGNSLTKRYRLDVTRATPSQELQLTNLAITQGSGRATGAPVGMTYTLSQEATVQINILQNGHRIRTINGGGTRAAGVNQATWDLKTDQGTTIPAGVYSVEVKAIHPTNGRVVRQFGTVLVTR
jgi:Carboxypeptidase regulatory-like domain/FlgD Ig-like domain